MKNIEVKGAKQHNLKNIDVIIPRDKLTVITGLSGSGKSSLAFDTLYAEGQRRYVESLSSYARQFLSVMDKPDVDHINGLSPAISIEQKSTSHNPRSTVGTVTEIYDYLRLLYARVGTPFCPDHGISLESQSIDQIVDKLFKDEENERSIILCPIVSQQKGEHLILLNDLKVRGFIRAKINGEIIDLDNLPQLNKNKKHDIDIVIDRLSITKKNKSRLSESIETALRESDGKSWHRLIMLNNNISFILHKPQLSENIGACARAIKNFNFQKMIVVDPKPIYPNDKILATSVGAKNIISKSKNFDNLESALKNIDVVIATSARFRNKNIKHIQLEDLKKIDYKKKVAFLFGSEASGLSNNEISYANYTLQIPTNPDFKSLNLSHSLIIIAQVVHSVINSKVSSFKKSKKVKSASKKDILSMFNLCIKNLEDIGFFKPKEKKPKMLENLRNIFYRMELSSKETRILSSVFASLGKKR